MDLRIIQKSQCLLCPATCNLKHAAGETSTHTAFLEMLSFAGTKRYKDFFKEVAEKWISLGGVPHWCKQWTFLEDEGVGIFEHVQDKYHDNLVKFNQILQTLSGSDGAMFVNKTMQKLLDIPMPK